MNNDTHINRPSDYPSWDEYYKATEIESMPLYHPELDSDLEGSDKIRPEYISEAIQYRTLDRQLWL